MRSPVALVLAVALTSGACQTRQGALVGGVVSTLGAAAAFGVTYSGRNDDEGVPIIFPLGGLVLGVIALASFVTAASLSDSAGQITPAAGSAGSATH